LDAGVIFQNIDDCPQLTTHNLLMIPIKVIRQIVRSLETGKLTHAQIAEKHRVSRNTVTMLARSRRSWGQSSKPRKPIRVQRHQSVRTQQMSQLVRRCPRCGYNIFPPCRICTARAAIAVEELKKFLQRKEAAYHNSSCM
jgi:predicted XRE-type DNA-binding protein